MSKLLLFAASLLASSALLAKDISRPTSISKSPMLTPSVSLGYVILYVRDVSASLSFYESAFGLTRRFFNDENGKAYGELETGAARLAFASLELVKAHVPEDIAQVASSPMPFGGEIALVTSDVTALFTRATKAGARAVSEPAIKPWGQTVAYVRDNAGHLVELCTAMP